MVLYAIYRNNKPVKDGKLPEQKGDIENTIIAVAEKQHQHQVNNSQPGDVEIGEKKEPENNKQGESIKKLDQVIASNQTEHKNTNNVKTKGGFIGWSENCNV